MTTTDHRAAIQEPIAGSYRVAKAEDSTQTIFGWASVAIRKDGNQVEDHHLDLIDPEDLEIAAYQFVLDAGQSGEDHLGDVDAHLVESVVFTKDKLEAMELPADALPLAWWVGFHIPDAEAYHRARKSKTMFSIEGTAVREELPDVQVALEVGNG